MLKRSIITTAYDRLELGSTSSSRKNILAGAEGPTEPDGEILLSSNAKKMMKAPNENRYIRLVIYELVAYFFFVLKIWNFDPNKSIWEVMSHKIHEGTYGELSKNAQNEIENIDETRTG